MLCTVLEPILQRFLMFAPQIQVYDVHMLKREVEGRKMGILLHRLREMHC